MFMDRKTRQHVSAFQFGLKIQWNFNKDSTRLFCGFCQTDSKVFFFFLLTGSTFLFSLAQDQSHFCKSSPTAPPPGFVPCSPQSLIFLLDCWSKPLGYLHLADIANDSPLSCHLQGLKRQRSPRGAVRHQSHQNPLGFSQVIPCCQDTPPPTCSAREDQAGPLPRQRRLGAILLCSHLLTWYIWCQEQKLLIRENAVMRYFFFSSLSS